MVATKSLKTAYIIIDTERCKGCRFCVSVCPRKIIGSETSLNKSGYAPASVNLEKARECTGCLACTTMCPEAAITVYRRAKPSSGN
ncbi:MAG TPA: 4Fe-4S dicluster domain-containing protein [Dehalococcoidales bacterium]